MSLRAHACRLAFLAALLLVAGGPPAQAQAQIYKWMDEKGQVHVTATPPPPSAISLDPKPDSKPPTEVAPRRTSQVRPSQAPRSASPQLPAAQASERIDCGRYRGVLQRAQSAQSAVEGLERAIERLENDAVATRRTSCTDEAERRGLCRSTYYNRDRELERSRERLTAAEDALADAEQAVRAQNVPRECLNKD